MNDKTKFSVIIPCYNEGPTIPLILKSFSKNMQRDDLEVILVDNGSTDESPLILRQHIPDYAFAKTIRVEVNRGYGFGILAGLEKAGGEYLGWTHADMQTDPRDVIEACTLIDSRGFPLDIYVKGNRKGRPLFDDVFTCGMSIFETLYLGVGLWDINAQPNIFHRSFYESWKNPPHDFSLDLYVYYLAKKNALTVVRFPVLFPERIYGESKWNTGFSSKWKFIKRTVDFSLQLKKHLPDTTET